MHTVSIRTPQPTPETAFPPSQSHPRIQFLHPGYDEGNNVLLVLPCVDRIEEDGKAVWGVHYLTALTACQILADNAWNGYLSLAKENPSTITNDNDTVLTKSQYWFIVPGCPKYPIIPNFQEWPFPSDLPESWPQPKNLDGTSSSNEARCLVTNALATHRAHLIPKGENNWFRQNNMYRFASNMYQDVNSVRNLISLCYELHQKLDDRVYAFIPKCGSYVVHILSDMATIADEALPEFVFAYQNLPLQRAGSVVREYLFARFAFNIFMFAKSFLTSSNVSRQVLRNLIGDDGEKVEKSVVKMTPSQLRTAFGGGGSKSASPRKRNRSAGSQNTADSEGSRSESISAREQKQADDEAWWEDVKAFEREEQRGRSRTRKRLASFFEDADKEDQAHPKRRKGSKSSSRPPTPPLADASFSTASDASGSSAHSELQKPEQNERSKANIESKHSIYTTSFPFTD